MRTCFLRLSCSSFALRGAVFISSCSPVLCHKTPSRRQFRYTKHTFGACVSLHKLYYGKSFMCPQRGHFASWQAPGSVRFNNLLHSAHRRCSKIGGNAARRPRANPARTAAKLLIAKLVGALTSSSPSAVAAGCLLIVIPYNVWMRPLLVYAYSWRGVLHFSHC